MKDYNIAETKIHLSKLVESAANGEQIIITKAGKPMALLVPYQHPVKQRKGGQWKDKVEIADDFDELPDEVAAAFRGKQR